MQNAVVFRCVRMIAEAAASIPLLVYDGDTELEDHPLQTLIRSPNPVATGTDLMECFYGHLLVSGNAYLEAVALDGELRELHALRPDRMKVIPGAEGWPEAYEYSVAGRTALLDGEPVPGVRRVLHMKLFHPANDHYGMSPIEAAATAIDIHNTAAKWNKSLLDNSARPSGALVYSARDGNLTPEQYERLKSELEVRIPRRPRRRPADAFGRRPRLEIHVAQPKRHGLHGSQERRRHEKSRSPSASPPSCSASPATPPTPTTQKPIAPSIARPSFRLPFDWRMRSHVGCRLHSTTHCRSNWISIASTL